MNQTLKVLSIIAVLTFVIISTVYGPPFNPPDGSGGPPVGAPIDGGISALIAAGIALVGRKYFKNKKNKKEE